MQNVLRSISLRLYFKVLITPHRLCLTSGVSLNMNSRKSCCDKNKRILRLSFFVKEWFFVGYSPFPFCPMLSVVLLILFLFFCVQCTHSNDSSLLCEQKKILLLLASSCFLLLNVSIFICWRRCDEIRGEQCKNSPEIGSNQKITNWMNVEWEIGYICMHQPEGTMRLPKWESTVFKRLAGAIEWCTHFIS